MGRTYGRDVEIESWKIYLGIGVAVAIVALLVWQLYIAPNREAGPLTTRDLPSEMKAGPESSLQPTGNPFKKPAPKGGPSASPTAKAPKVPGRS